jgi:cellulose synthase/poly-beta-1,6-N-acetylglucosamine synthase-like glycosyltransferase
VDVVLATREPPVQVQARIANLLDTDYPASGVHVIVGLDAAVAAEIEAYRGRLGPGVTVVPASGGPGKAGALNAAVAAARGPLLAFCDTAQRFERTTLTRLVNMLLASPDRGGVSGRVVMRSGSGFVDGFWALNVMILRGQAASGGIVSVSGAVYLMRRELWRDVPEGAICDDLFVTLTLARHGRPVGYVVDALAVDDRQFTRRQNFRRKVRIVTGLLQFCAMNRWALSPASNPLWIHFACQKLLRFATPFLTAVGGVAIVLALPAAARVPLAAAAGLAAATLALLAVGGPRRVRRAVGSVAWLASMQLVPVVAAANALRGQWGVWSHERSRLARTGGAHPDSEAGGGGARDTP